MNKATRNTIALLTIAPIAISIPGAAVYSALASGMWSVVVASFMLAGLGGATVAGILFNTLSLGVHDETETATLEQKPASFARLTESNAATAKAA